MSIDLEKLFQEHVKDVVPENMREACNSELSDLISETKQKVQKIRDFGMLKEGGEEAHVVFALTEWVENKKKWWAYLRYKAKLETLGIDDPFAFRFFTSNLRNIPGDQSRVKPGLTCYQKWKIIEAEDINVGDKVLWKRGVNGAASVETTVKTIARNADLVLLTPAGNINTSPSNVKKINS